MRRNLLISVAALVAGLAVGLLWIREPMESLTEHSLSEARLRWHREGPSAYWMKYQMNRDTYEVVAVDGHAIEARVNGIAPRTERLGTYSMEGLFDLLESELENIKDPTGPFSGRSEAVIAKVKFHPRDGRVEKYLRNSAGVARGAHIQLLQFEPGPADSSHRPLDAPRAGDGRSP